MPDGPEQSIELRRRSLAKLGPAIAGVLLLYALGIRSGVSSMGAGKPELWLFLALVVDFPMFIGPVLGALQWSPWERVSRMPRFDEMVVIDDTRWVVLQGRDRLGAAVEARVRTHVEAEQRLTEAGATRVGVFCGASPRNTRARNLVGAVAGSSLLLLLFETLAETVYVTNWVVGPVAITGALLAEAMVARQTVLLEGDLLRIHDWRGTTSLLRASISQAHLVEEDVHLELTGGQRKVLFSPSSARTLVDRLTRKH